MAFLPILILCHGDLGGVFGAPRSARVACPSLRFVIRPAGTRATRVLAEGVPCEVPAQLFPEEAVPAAPEGGHARPSSRPLTPKGAGEDVGFGVRP